MVIINASIFLCEDNIIWSFFLCIFVKCIYIYDIYIDFTEASQNSIRGEGDGVISLNLSGL